MHSIHMSFIFLLLLIFLALTVSPVGYAKSPTNSDEAKLQLQQVKAQVKVSKKALRSARQDYSQKEKQLAKISNQLSTHQKQHQRTKKELTILKSKIEVLVNKQTVLGNSLQKQSGWLKDDLVRSYQQGQSSQIALALTERKPSETSRLLEYANYVNQAREDKITLLLKNKERFRKIGQELAQHNQALNIKAAELVRQTKKYQALKSQQSKLLSNIQKEISQKNNQLSQYQQNQTHLTKLVDELLALESVTSTLEDIPFQRLKGRLHQPINGKIVRRFGQRPSSSESKLKGIWIQSSDHQRVQAVHHGQVLFAEWLRGYGHLIIIDHGDNFYTLYGQNKSLLRTTGDWVMSGDPIAISSGDVNTGDINRNGISESGTNAKTGLYFEIRQNGQAVNPASWLAKE